MTDYKRVSASLPTEVVDLLDEVSRRLHFSRSALLSKILLDMAPVLVSVCNSIPDEPTPENVRRFKGDSIEALNALYQEAVDNVTSDTQGDLNLGD